ncbi:penicillin-binding protein 2, partial [candidate division WOR-3 bacterium]|nr:penicillin-binding protein 2 [candidate division WOR-3 bacterium]
SLTGFAAEAGLGRTTGIDLPGERAGNVPTRAWLDKRYGKGRWGAGSVLNFAIGQGEVLVTPLQLAVLYAAIANDGIACRPHILDRADSAGHEVYRARAETGRLPVSEVDIRQVKAGLDRVVEYGTAAAVRMREVTIAGKTGTAQNPPRPDHAWFVGYAPADAPEVVFSVLVENAGHGGSVAAPIAARLIRAWFFPGEVTTDSEGP